MSAQEDTRFVYGIVGNIPAFYHSSDLRNYFSQFIETGGFDCFHFRHRPEQKIPKKETTTTVTVSGSSSERNLDASQLGDKTSKTTCCVVKLKDTKLQKFIKMYHKKHWLDRNEESIPRLCFISKIKVVKNTGLLGQIYKTRGEMRQITEDRQVFTENDLQNLLELHPPDIMPNGNVGTPTKTFLRLIKECRLPPNVIKKLGLTFPKTRSRRIYGDVPYDYGGTIVEGESEEELDIKSRKGTDIFDENILIKNRASKEKKEVINGDKTPEQNQEPESEEDADDCEEWERHEALHDDPFKVEKNKEGCRRLFEQELEVQWEKGGSGLVFYTDAQYWDQKEGDFDERTADDWDVDMSGYYEDGAGDKDSRDYITMRRDKRRREGLESTDMETVGIGKFERHTKGFGRKVMEKRGWKDGQGLGTTIIGISDALENDGQAPYDKRGFGYHGEKLERFREEPGHPQPKKKKRAERTVVISTVYDEPEDTDPQEPLLRRRETHHLSYRDVVKFTKASDALQ